MNAVLSLETKVCTGACMCSTGRKSYSSIHRTWRLSWSVYYNSHTENKEIKRMRNDLCREYIFTHWLAAPFACFFFFLLTMRISSYNSLTIL